MAAWLGSDQWHHQCRSTADGRVEMLVRETVKAGVAG